MNSPINVGFELIQVCSVVYSQVQGCHLRIIRTIYLWAVKLQHFDKYSIHPFQETRQAYGRCATARIDHSEDASQMLPSNSVLTHCNL